MAEDRKVIDLGEVRFKKEQEIGKADHENGYAFLFQQYVFTDDIGVTEDDQICVLTSPEELVGLLMTREDAKKLGEALIGASQTLIPKDIDGT